MWLSSLGLPVLVSVGGGGWGVVGHGSDSSGREWGQGGVGQPLPKPSIIDARPGQILMVSTHRLQPSTTPRPHYLLSD